MIEKSREKVLLSVRVQPRAGRNEIAGVRDGALLIRVTAVPEKGKANKAIIALLSKSLRLPKSTFSLFRGAKSRDKTFAIEGIEEGDLRARIEKILSD